MKLTLIQRDVIYANPEANLEAIEAKLASHPLGDLVILPELATTGYLFDEAADMHALAEAVSQSKTLHRVAQWAKRYQADFLIGLPEREADRYYNSAFWVGEKGLKASYRKQCLTPVDQRFFERGEQLCTVQFKGFTFGVAICFDIWFPELARAYLHKGVDVLLHPANFGGPQSLAIARARAIENQMYTVTCNRLGREQAAGIEGVYCGQSQVVAPSGTLILEMAQETEVASVYLEKLVVPKRVLGVDVHKAIENLV